MPPLPRPSAVSVPLTTKRLLHLYAPLALTFLLMSGSSPIVNKGIGRLPNEITGLATFVNAFGLGIFIYSPCFAVRDIALKYVRGRASYKRTLLFLFAFSSLCTGLLLLISVTSLLDGPLLRGVMQLPGNLLEPVKKALLAFLPIPVLICLRGVHQAAHITNDTPKWIGLGTLCRFSMMILFVFGIGVPMGLSGGVLGGLAFAIGIATEMIVNTISARRVVGLITADQPGDLVPSNRELFAFSGPLFLANLMGVLLQPLTLAIANTALFSETSAAAFGIVKSFTWFFSSTLFAMQAVALAKADSVRNVKRLALFELIPVGAFTSLILVVVFVTPARIALLEGFFEIDDARTVEFITTALPVALVLPLFMALRSTARGLIIRSGRTSWVTYASLGALALLLLLNALNLSEGRADGATVGYLCWMGALAVEMAVLVFGVMRVGLNACVTESGRTPSFREEEVEGELAAGAGVNIPDR